MNPMYHMLNWLDYTIIAIMLVSIAVSFFRDFMREMISLIVWLAAIFIAFKFSNTAQWYLSHWITLPAVRYGVAFAGLFVIVLMAGMFINSMVLLLINRAGLSMTDRILGTLFGACRGILVVAIIAMFIGFDPVQEQHILAQSQLVSAFDLPRVWVSQFLP